MATSPPATTNMTAQLAAIALELFDAQGYDNVTTEQVAAAAGVSQRTFFRHFASKASVVFDGSDDATAAFMNMLYSQPAALSVTAALINAIAQQADAFPLTAEDVVRSRLVRSTPSLTEAIRAYEARFEDDLTRWIAQRHGRDRDDFDVRLTAATLVAARRVVIDEWSERHGEVSLVELARHAIETLRPRLGLD